METITVELPPQLAEDVRQHQADLTRILEIGLAQIKAERATPPDATETQHTRAMAERARIMQVLAADPHISVPTLDPEMIRRHNHPPIEVGGKPLSEIIIEDRGPLSVLHEVLCADSVAAL